jgi:hypothetical protein
MKALHVEPVIESKETSNLVNNLLEWSGEAKMSRERAAHEGLLQFIAELPEPMRSEE